MADVRPFRGIRFATTAHLDDLVAPPYDVLSEAQAAALRDRSPFNAVHLDLPVGPGETPNAAAYERSAARLADWLRRGVLVRDAAPCIYLVRQTYRGPDGRERNRRGFIARLALADLSVLPHEKTHSGPKTDRLSLYRATHADLSQIFLLFPDDDGRIAAALDAVTSPVAQSYDAHDSDGNLHVVTPLCGAEAEAVAALLQDRTLYIADGHHRYETALAYRDERRAVGDRSADTMMVYLCAMNDPGLTVFPTHRLIRHPGLPPMSEALRRLEPSFTVVSTVTGDARASETHLAQWLEADPEEGRVFGLLFPRESSSALVRLSDPAALDGLRAEGFSSASAGLTVTILHYLILRDALGIDPATAEGRIDYASDAPGAFARLAEGDYDLGAFIWATQVQEVRTIADQSETMPQKSTYFYPKLLTGLVFDALGE